MLSEKDPENLVFALDTSVISEMTTFTCITSPSRVSCHLEMAAVNPKGGKTEWGTEGRVQSGILNVLVFALEYLTLLLPTSPPNGT